MAAKKPVTGVDEAVVAYLSDASEQAQDRYAQVRQIVHAQSEGREVGEVISYRMPTFYLGGKRLLYVGLWDEHLALYPVPDSEADPRLVEDLEPYRKGKGTLHFRYRDVWPGELIARFVAAHVERIG